MATFSPFFSGNAVKGAGIMETLCGLDLLASAVMILDADRRIIYVNPAAEDLLEYSSKVLLCQRLEQMMGPHSVIPYAMV